MRLRLFASMTLVLLASCSKGKSSTNSEPPPTPDKTQTQPATPPKTGTVTDTDVDPYASAIDKQYGSDDLTQRLVKALKAAGKDPDHLTRADIAGFADFHIGLRPATKALAKLAKIKKGDKVLDLGSGLGGPASTLAMDFGAHVTALELVKSFNDAAKFFADKTGVKGVDFVQGDALAVPAKDHTYDVVWEQHVMMNIKDKKKMFSEIARVLKKNGRFAVHSILLGKNTQPLTYPTPWADTPDISFMVNEEQYKKLAADAGLKLVTWKNMDAQSLKFFTALKKKIAAHKPGTPPPLGPNLIMTSSAPVKVGNMFKNLKSGRITIFMAVFQAQ